jgi:hypothetical protein
MKTLHKVLEKALSTKRPHDTKATVNFSHWLADNLPDGLAGTFDDCGNLHVDTRSSEQNRTLFVAHVDTVHRKQGKNRIKKTRTHWYADGDVLGADDGAGVAMLMHLIHAGIPAYYIFTVGEEKGGIGATWLAKHNADLLLQFDRAIAFDRRGIDSVITHQGFGRCCSDDFGNALCAAIGAIDDNLMHLNDDTGVYTDTAEFTDLIPECTNVSIGYSNEHTVNESLNIVYFNMLANALVHVDFDSLPTVRDPADVDDWSMYRRTGYWSTDWSDYTVYSTASNDDLRDYLYSALLDAQYGFHRDLIDLVAAHTFPDDPALMAKHLDPKRLNPRLIDDLMADLDADMFDADTALNMLADDMYSHL